MDKNIIEEYLPLVKSIAAKYSFTSLPFEDLVQEGTIGLWEAWQRFDPEREAKFSTYATYWIKKRILDAVNREHKTSLDAFEYKDSFAEPSHHKHEEIETSSTFIFPKKFPELEKEILTLLYGLTGNGCYDLAEIGEKLDLPRERVRQLKEKGLRRLRKVGIELKK